MNKRIKIIAVLIAVISVVYFGSSTVVQKEQPSTKIVKPTTAYTTQSNLTYKMVKFEPILPTEEPSTPIISDDIITEPLVIDNQITQEEIDLIALVTMAEAEGECEEGKRLVIDTILNRVDSEHFPDTIHDVIYQPNQFSPMWNGRIERCEVREEICQLVLEELETRTNYDVMFFTAGRYSKYGVPLFKVENHYFSSYK